MKFAFIKANSSEFSVKKMCDVLEVSRSGYYDWLERPPSSRETANESLLEKIRDAFAANREVYGSLRIAKELQDMGYVAGKNRVAAIMRKHGITAKIEKKFRVKTTDSNHQYPISPNLLNQVFTVSGPNQAWVSDITYILVGDGWRYLCIIEDLFNREIVGWSLGDNLRTGLVTSAFHQAVATKKPQAGMIFHSDRGAQYASHEFRDELEKHGILSSMSRTGNCYDNAPAESFFHTLKVEEVYRKKYATEEEARRNLFDYIEVFYNRIRKHSSLNYLSPTQYLLAWKSA